MSKLISLILFGLLSFQLIAQDKKVNWMSFEEAVEANKQDPKKIFIDVYTNWCGWCKRMDNTTFKDVAIIDFLNEHYYAVKLNAEMTDTVIFKEVVFVSQENGRRPVHQLAISLLDSKMSYPTNVFLDENFALLSRVPGYLDATSINPILHYFQGNHQTNIPWEEYLSKWEAEHNSKSD